MEWHSAYPTATIEKVGMTTINQGDNNTGVEVNTGDHSPVTINLPPRETAPKQDWV
jgi:hypothetical protein